MIIQSSSSSLTSARTYSSKYQTVQTTQRLNDEGQAVSGGTGNPGFVSYFVDGLKQMIDQNESLESEDENQEKETGDNENGDSLSELLSRYQNTQSVKTASLGERLSQVRKIRQQTIDYLLEILFGRKSAASYLGEGTESGSSLEGISLDMSSLSSDYSITMANAPTTQAYRQTTYFHYEENESVSFSAQGKVIAADGREIDFNMEVNLSRSFVMDTQSIHDYTVPVYTDPLVIQLDGSLPSVSDMKFFFDLDSDGEEEEMSMLGSGNGFLALDRNGDGIINDGSELFGTASGNGFNDLARYDVDRNGWIDEADEIFDKLRIWMKQEDGTDKLLTLKEANVGAINLDSVGTKFAYNNEANLTNAMARRNGFFLYEDGTAGSVQQLDMAT